MKRKYFSSVVILTIFSTVILAQTPRHAGENSSSSRANSRPVDSNFDKTNSTPLFYLSYGTRSVEDILYNHVAYRSQDAKKGKAYYVSSTSQGIFLTQGMRAKFEKQVVDQMAKDGLVSFKKIGYFTLMIDKENFEKLKNKKFCMVYGESLPASSRSFECTDGASLNSDLTKTETAGTIIKRNGFTKVADFSQSSEIRGNAYSRTLYMKD